MFLEELASWDTQRAFLFSNHIYSTVEEPHVLPIRYFHAPPITFLLTVDPIHMPGTIPSIFQYIAQHALRGRVDYVRVLLTQSPKKPLEEEEGKAHSSPFTSPLALARR